MDKQLTEMQAYQAMIKFLSDYYELTKSDDIGSLLGSMDLIKDGLPADRAMWREWQECTALVLKSDVHNKQSSVS